MRRAESPAGTAAATSTAWAVIPARGGSVGIPRKNLRRLGGKPLIGYAIDTALSVLPQERVIVITDDQEIASVSEHTGASVILETMRTPGDETLDAKILRNLPALRAAGALDDDLILTIQPTSPLLSADTLRRAIESFDDPATRSVLTVVPDQHLRWRPDIDGVVKPAYVERVNRQSLPMEYRETGGVIAARLKDIESQRTRIIAPTVVLPVSADEALDIDSYADLYAAAHLLSRLRGAIRVDASRTLGMGHVYRMLALVSELSRHELTIYLSADAALGQQFFSNHPHRVSLVADEADFLAQLEASRPDLVVLDRLDTEVAEITGIRRAAPGAKIVSFEDRGPGATQVDLLVTEFIEAAHVPDERKLVGIDFSLLSPGFETEPPGPARSGEVAEILVLFGGTDPSGLAVRALNSLARIGFSGSVTVARGLGATPLDSDQVDANPPYRLTVLENVPHMPTLMSRADLAFTSAGRTVVELLARGTPAICLAQNEKELTHNHATDENGIVHLGLGTEVTDDELDAAASSMLDDHALRRTYAERAAQAGLRRSNSRTIATMLSRLGFTPFPDL